MKKNFKRTLAFLVTFTMVISCLIINFSITTSADAVESNLLYDFENTDTIPDGVTKEYANDALRGSFEINKDSQYAKSGQSLKINGITSGVANRSQEIYFAYTHTEGYNGVSFWLYAPQYPAAGMEIYLENLEAGIKVLLFERFTMAAGEKREITALYADGGFVPSNKASQNRVVIRYYLSTSRSSHFFVDDVCEIKVDPNASALISNFDDFSAETGLPASQFTTTWTNPSISRTEVALNTDPANAKSGNNSLKFTSKKTGVSRSDGYAIIYYTHTAGSNGISFWVANATRAFSFYIELVNLETNQTKSYPEINVDVNKAEDITLLYEDANGSFVPSSTPNQNVIRIRHTTSTNFTRSFYVDDIYEIKAVNTPVVDPWTIANFEGYTETPANVNATSAKDGHQPTVGIVRDPRDAAGNALKVIIPKTQTDLTNFPQSYLEFKFTHLADYQGVSFWMQADNDITFEARIVTKNSAGSTAEESTLRRISLKAGEAQKITALYADFKVNNSLVAGETLTAKPMTYEGLELYLRLYAHTGSAAKSFVIDDVAQFNPAFSDASLSLSDDIGLNYKLDPANLAGHTASVDFELGGTTTTVTDYTQDSNGRYVYRFDNIDPSKINDTITATLKLNDKFNAGEEFAVATKTYSVAEYCYNMMEKKSDDADLCHLLADILEYGAKAQVYAENNPANLATDKLDASYKTWIARDPDELTGVTDIISATAGVTAPTASWTAAGMYLDDVVNIRLTFKTELDISNIKAQVTSENLSATITTFESLGGNKYSFLIEDVNPSYMREVLSVVLYNGETPISNTVSYSVETYAAAKANDSNAALAALVKALIKYGDSAAAYVAAQNAA